MTPIQDFHTKHNYYVAVNVLPDSIGCNVTFPKNVLQKHGEIQKTYIVSDNYSIGYYVLFDDKTHSECIQACSNNVRLLVVQDIILTALELNISTELIITENTEKNLFNILYVPLTPEQKDKETQLCVEFRKLLSGEVPESDLEGYDQLVTYFERGGFIL